MTVTTLHDREEIFALLGRDPALHSYELGDLDDFFWPYTTWYRLPGGRVIVLLFTGADSGPVLLALSRPEDTPELHELVTALLPVLPRRFYAHLTGGAEQLLSPAYSIEDHGAYSKMHLKHLTPVGGASIVLLTSADLPELLQFYQHAYPGNHFDARMLDAGAYVGVRQGGKLVTVAGTHIHSPTRRIAALGNVATLPEFRGKGLASVAISALCQRLLSTVDHIGLNVATANTSAVCLYERLGFAHVTDYRELIATAR